MLLEPNDKVICREMCEFRDFMSIMTCHIASGDSTAHRMASQLNILESQYIDNYSDVICQAIV